MIYFQAELNGNHEMTDDTLHPERITKSEANSKLFRSYEEHVDKLISQALLNGIEARYAINAIEMYFAIEI